MSITVQAVTCLHRTGDGGPFTQLRRLFTLPFPPFVGLQLTWDNGDYDGIIAEVGVDVDTGTVECWFAPGAFATDDDLAEHAADLRELGWYD